MIVVGEASGDLHGSQVVKALLDRDPTMEFFGAGGEHLRRHGVRVVFDVARLSGMGLSELRDNLGALWEAYRLFRRALREERPDLVILVDFPEFNLRLARLARQLRIPVLYYISPQVWAWRRGRVRKIAKSVDRLAVVFPFEAPLYEREGVKVTFVGHPLLDLVRPTQTREQTLAQYGLDPARKTIALLPGSRKREVAYHLGPMIEAAERLGAQEAVQFLLVRATTVERAAIENAVAAVSAPVEIVEGNTYNVLNAADLVWLASGTATLEAALLEKPMVIVYRMAWLTYALARLLVRVDHIGMVNIIAGERVAPELIQSELTAERICRETQRLLSDPALRAQTVRKLACVKERLGTSGAAARVAEMALAMLA
ncbi:MAG TPA: lipid-A-disaccharide synthase [Candidatus Acidoferrales bacterium]|nr:lipid-A-disaccharide synthase [Candidatus Acidoferrales bacterium]